MPEQIVPATKEPKVAAMAIAYESARRSSGDLLIAYLRAYKAIAMATEQDGTKIDVLQIMQAIQLEDDG
ncbi:MAG: hypothetical protein AAFZ49_01760 [Cyanobacteria bacterium J06659_2]